MHVARSCEHVHQRNDLRHPSIRACVRACVRVSVRVCVCACVRACVRACVHRHKGTFITRKRTTLPRSAYLLKCTYCYLIVPINTSAYLLIHRPTCVHIPTHIAPCTCLHTCLHTSICISTYGSIHMSTHVSVHIRTYHHMSTHTCTHMSTHTHNYRQSASMWHPRICLYTFL